MRQSDRRGFTIRMAGSNSSAISVGLEFVMDETASGNFEVRVSRGVM